MDRRLYCLQKNGVITMTQQNNEQCTKAVGNADEINELLRRYGVKFGIYKNGVFNEQFFPFDPIPRVIPAEDFKSIEKGLVQRVNALNEFLFDIYHEKKIVRDGIIPEDFIYISKGYLAQCEGITPKKQGIQPYFRYRPCSGKGRRMVHTGGQSAYTVRRFLSAYRKGAYPYRCTAGIPGK